MSMTIFIKFIIHMMAFCHADDTHDSEPRTWAGHGTQHSLIRRCPHNKVLRPKIQDIRTCPGHVRDTSWTLVHKEGFKRGYRTWTWTWTGLINLI